MNCFVSLCQQNTCERTIRWRTRRLCPYSGGHCPAGEVLCGEQHSAVGRLTNQPGMVAKAGARRRHQAAQGRVVWAAPRCDTGRAGGRGPSRDSPEVTAVRAQAGESRRAGAALGDVQRTQLGQRCCSARRTIAVPRVTAARRDPGTRHRPGGLGEEPGRNSP